ncbi:MAG: hypothetical protein M3R37_02470 [Actinomycetota bacterium]|nr:hypothetical protein [Actinomycetota bacterium]
MRVAGDLDVVAAANGLLDLLRQLGRDAPTIAGDQAKQLEDAVKSSSFELWSGRDDHLLRRLLLKADLGLDVPPTLRRCARLRRGSEDRFRAVRIRPQ